MRLINTETLQLENFSDERTAPLYAILSHRWVEGQEVQYASMSSSGDREAIKGWKKIRRCCKRAADSKLTHVWIDTCCIDQSSSAELSEAINSMYRWYESSRVCYAYLADVRYAEGDDDSWLLEFENSEWFKRSWTLQELIAPGEVRFYDKQWRLLGRKVRRFWATTQGAEEEDDLSRHIENATGIPRDVLVGKASLEDFSIAQRMSWAADRKATRIEDVAYSLLGLFDVNMAMIYGEGLKAFTRLQEEIIRQTNDHTIFAWSGKDQEEPVSAVSNSPTMDLGDFYNSLTSISERRYSYSTPRSLLAKSPEYFRECKHTSKSPTTRRPESYSITNLGLSISLPLKPWAMHHYLAILDCASQHGTGSQIAIFLQHIQSNDSYRRVEIGGKDLHPVKGRLPNQQRRRINIQLLKSSTISYASIARELTRPLQQTYGFEITARAIFKKDETSSRHLYVVYSRNSWSLDKRILEIPEGSCGTAGIIDISPQNLFVAAIKLGFDFDFNPVCIIADHTASKKTLQERDWTTWTYQQDGSDDLAGKNIFQINCMENKGWNAVEHRQAVPNPTLPQGIWAFKGDSVLGLSFDIPSLRLSIEIKQFVDGDNAIWKFESEGLSAKPRDKSPLPRSATA